MTHEHLSDEQLSAHLDGQNGDGPAAAVPGRTADEVAGCPTCRERLEALTRVKALVGLPVDPVLPSMRAAAVASALAEASAPEAGPTAPVTDLRPLAVRRWRSPQVWTGAAAAAVILLVVVGAAIGLSHRSKGPTASSAAAPERSATKTHGAAGTVPAPFSANAQGSVTDLGSLPSVEALKAGVTRVLGSEKSFDQSQSASGTNANGTPTKSDAAAPGLSATTIVPSAFSSCVTAAQSDAEGTGSLQLVATATYEKTPALVVVVGVSGSSSTATGRVVVVVAQSGCRLLAHTAL